MSCSDPQRAARPCRAASGSEARESCRHAGSVHHRHSRLGSRLWVAVRALPERASQLRSTWVLSCPGPCSPGLCGASFLKSSRAPFRRRSSRTHALRRGPSLGIATRHLRSVAAWPSGIDGRFGKARIGVEAAGHPQADEEVAWTWPVLERHGVVTSAGDGAGIVHGTVVPGEPDTGPRAVRIAAVVEDRDGLRHRCRHRCRGHPMSPDRVSVGRCPPGGRDGATSWIASRVWPPAVGRIFVSSSASG